MYIESGDSDILRIDELAAISRIQRLDDRPYLDALSGENDYSPHTLAQNDYLLFSLRAHSLARKLLRDHRLRPDRNKYFNFYNQILTAGFNTAFTAEAYAMIGGYLPKQLCEDFDIGRRIAIMRGITDNNGHFIPNTYTVERIPIRMDSSPRRFVHAMTKCTNAYTHFSDMKTTNECRKINLYESVRGLPYDRLCGENVIVFERELNKQWEFFLRTVVNPNDRSRLFHRLMLFLGFGRYSLNERASGASKVTSYKISNANLTKWKADYHMDGGKVVIDSVENIQRALCRYREKHSNSC